MVFTVWQSYQNGVTKTSKYTAAKKVHLTHIVPEDCSEETLSAFSYSRINCGDYENIINAHIWEFLLYSKCPVFA